MVSSVVCGRRRRRVEVGGIGRSFPAHETDASGAVVYSVLGHDVECSVILVCCTAQSPSTLWYVVEEVFSGDECAVGSCALLGVAALPGLGGARLPLA